MTDLTCGCNPGRAIRCRFHGNYGTVIAEPSEPYVEYDPKVKCRLFWDQFIRPQMLASGVPEDGLAYLRERYSQDASTNHAALMAIDVAFDAARRTLPSGTRLVAFQWCQDNCGGTTTGTHKPLCIVPELDIKPAAYPHETEVHRNAPTAHRLPSWGFRCLTCGEVQDGYLRQRYAEDQARQHGERTGDMDG